ncbi:MAG: autotransporter-associated beta strand repeat-containing protein, partial [Luteolibacter sp.]
SYTTHAELEFKLTTGNQQIHGGTFSGTGKLIKTGGDELILSNWGGAQIVALTGADSVIDVQAGKLSNFAASAFGAPHTVWSNNKAGLTVASGATFEMNNTSVIVDELSGAGTINKGTWDTPVTLTIGVNDGSGNFSGMLAQPVGTALSLVKQGSGTQILSGMNTYKGPTTVSAGTLVINGNQSAANGAVSVTGKLTGSGTVGGATTIDSAGIHNAGNPTVAGGVGSQAFSSTLNYANGSIFEWDLNANSTASGFDTVSAVGNITVGTATVFKVIFGTGVDLNNTFWSTPFTTESWSMTSIFGKAFSSGSFSSVTSTADPITQGSFSITGSTLTWTAVPEPTSALAGLLLGAGLLRRKRATP